MQIFDVEVGTDVVVNDVSSYVVLGSLLCALSLPSKAALLPFPD